MSYFHPWHAVQLQLMISFSYKHNRPLMYQIHVALCISFGSVCMCEYVQGMHAHSISCGYIAACHIHFTGLSNITRWFKPKSPHSPRI